MALLPAYAVDGGRVPAAMARRATYALSAGANGVIAVDDLKVTPLPTPGRGVQIQRGGAIVRQRTSGASQFESYVIAQDSATNLDIPATQRDPRTDYVIARVVDWHFTGGAAPDNPADAIYWEFARVNTLDGISTPYVPLARIDLPADRATVTEAVITDLRQVAIPRRERNTVLTYVENPQDLTSDLYHDWPQDANLNVEVPEWAGRAIVRADIVEALLTGNGNADGHLTLMLGNQPAYTGQRRFDDVWAGSTARVDHPVVSEFTIPEHMRGTVQPLRVRARRRGGSGHLRADAYTQVIWDIEFQEQVV